MRSLITRGVRLLVVMFLFTPLVGCSNPTRQGADTTDSSAETTTKVTEDVELALNSLGFSAKNQKRIGLVNKPQPTSNAKANDPNANDEVDSVTYAYAYSYAIEHTVLYFGTCSFTRYVDGEASKFVRMVFVLNRNLNIIYLDISIDPSQPADYENIVDVRDGDDPLMGLPVNTIGEARDYSFSLRGFDNDGVNYAFLYDPSGISSCGTITSAYFEDDLFGPQEPVVAELYLTSRRKAVACDLPDGVSPDNFVLYTLNTYSQYKEASGIFESWYYRETDGGFESQFNPLGKSVLYYVVDHATGIEYARGSLEFSYEGDLSINIGESSQVSLLLPGNVMQTSFPEGGNGNVWYSDQLIDGTDEDGNPCKVYITNLHGGELYFHALGLQEDDREVSIFEAETGEEVAYAVYYSGGAAIRLDEGYDQIIIVIRGTPAMGGYYPNGFTVFFSQLEGLG